MNKQRIYDVVQRKPIEEYPELNHPHVRHSILYKLSGSIDILKYEKKTYTEMSFNCLAPYNTFFLIIILITHILSWQLGDPQKPIHTKIHSLITNDIFPLISKHIFILYFRKTNEKFIIYFKLYEAV